MNNSFERRLRVIGIQGCEKHCVGVQRWMTTARGWQCSFGNWGCETQFRGELATMLKLYDEKKLRYGHVTEVYFRFISFLVKFMQKLGKRQFVFCKRKQSRQWGNHQLYFVNSHLRVTLKEDVLTIRLWHRSKRNEFCYSLQMISWITISLELYEKYRLIRKPNTDNMDSVFIGRFS